MNNIKNDYSPLSIKKSFRYMNKPLLFLTLFLMVVGTLNIVNTSSFEITNNGHIYSYFLKQCIFIFAGAIVSYFILKIPTKFYSARIMNSKIRIYHILYTLILGLVIGCFFMPAVRGAQIRFFITSTIGFQPSEFAKPIVILSLACLFEEWSNRIKNRRKTNWLIELIKFGVIGLLIPLLVFKQKDLGTATILGGIAVIMFLASDYPKDIKNKIVAFFAIAAIFIVGLFVIDVKYDIGILSDAQKSRLTGFFTPCDNYQNEGYQVCNAFIAMNQGGLTGLGIGNSKQKYTYLVEPHTDSVFAIIAEECGVIVTTGILALLFSVIIIIYSMCKRISSYSGKAICFGVSWYLFIHLFINLGGLLGIIPLTGVPLPFFTYGGTFAFCLLCTLTLVQKVWIEEKTKIIKV